MKIHHLNCGTLCPPGGGLMDGGRGWLRAGHLVCHCLLIETDQGLVLVDTGLGMGDVRNPGARISPLFRRLLGVRLREKETAFSQVKALGHDPRDVRHIVLTHLDFDHAGGIEDFPEARVHVLREELWAARNRSGFVGKRRYQPRQWDAGVRWETYGQEGEPWYGFQAVRNLRGLPPELLMVPLLGHTKGHCGIAVETPEGWLLHVGDAYFHHGEMNLANPDCPPGLRAYQTMMEVDRACRLWNQVRLRNLKRQRGDRIRLFCAHDEREWRQAVAQAGGAGWKMGNAA